MARDEGKNVKDERNKPKDGSLEIELDYGNETVEDYDHETLIIAGTNDDEGVTINRRVGLCEFVCAAFSLFVMNKPKKAGLFVASGLLGFFILANLTLKNGYPKGFDLNSVIELDYSTVTSKYDMSLGAIDHWCLQGGDSNCRCEDPLLPIDKLQFKYWSRTFEMNKQCVDEYVMNDDIYFENMDVVFLGENIVEAWAGRSVGMNSTTLLSIKKLFSKRFNKEEGGKFNGLPLGIAGDSAPNVLWRIQNGEVPSYLYPKVWWLVIGTNDLALKQCSEEVVLLGILRVIEEIQEMRPDAKIIVSSILPMTTDVKGRVPTIVKSDKTEKKDKAEKNDNKGDRRTLKKDEKLTGREKEILDDQKVSSKEEKDIEEKREKILQNKEKIQKIKVIRNKVPAVAIRNPHAFIRAPTISMWPSVVAINQQLKAFCNKHKHMAFFDANDVFIDKSEGFTPRMREDLFSNKFAGVPSIDGHQYFLDAIVRKLNLIFDKQEEKISDEFDDDYWF